MWEAPAYNKVLETLNHYRSLPFFRIVENELFIEMSVLLFYITNDLMIS